jgi:hypothetical protein
MPGTESAPSVIISASAIQKASGISQQHVNSCYPKSDVAARIIDRIDCALSTRDGEIAVEPLVYTKQEISRMLAEGNAFLEQALEVGVTVYER